LGDIKKVKDTFRYKGLEIQDDGKTKTDLDNELASLDYISKFKMVDLSYDETISRPLPTDEKIIEWQNSGLDEETAFEYYRNY